MKYLQLFVNNNLFGYMKGYMNYQQPPRKLISLKLLAISSAAVSLLHICVSCLVGRTFIAYSTTANIPL